MLLHKLLDENLNMAFNVYEPINKGGLEMPTDKEIIDNLGGPAAVAGLLGFEKHRGTQRVFNWMTRGIPAQVKVDYPELFMPAAKSGNKQLTKKAA